MKRGNVIELFAARAAESPGRVAIERDGRAVTYGELDALSNGLANHLLAAGAAKGTAVAVLAEDAFVAITSILGILKAACVFVPLDPGLPEKRLAAMAALVAPRWFVVEPQFAALAEGLAGGADSGATVVRAEGDAGGAPSAFPDTRPPAPQSAPDDMCYVYFTSGSTGTPKGIAGRLKGIDHFIRWEIETLGAGPETRVSQLLPYSFDGSLRDIFVPLCAGGTVCVPPTRETILDARRLTEWLDARRIDIVHCVPSLFRALVNETLRPELFPALKYILMAGEPLLPSDVKRWMSVFGERVQLVNLYGNSETTMAKFVYFVRPSDADRRSIPIGKPMPGAAAVVVDARGRPCPTGVIGEIYIRTPYRSLGYYNQPELTRESFVPNPFGSDPQDIVYKTGDLGRVLEDGNYEYLGRQDQQVKIRGNRVELEEVESLLRGHAAVEDVAVVDREDAAGFKYLCAYVVLNDPEATAELRDYAASSLPDFMTPSAFVQMNELPRTISGKIDRRALAALGQPQAGAEHPYSPPRNPVEELVCAVWSQVLGLARVGAHDHFFHAGGHSLSATRVVSRLRDALGVELTLRDLFEAPTVEALARRIDAARERGAARPEAPAAPALRTRPRDGSPLPLSFAQQRLWFLHQLEPRSAAYNLATAVRLRGELSAGALERALGEVVRRHEALRTTFEEVDGRPAQIIHEPRGWALPVVDLSDAGAEEREERVRAEAAAEAGRPFDLRRGPTLRSTLLRLSPDEHVLLLTMHHIVSDGWSMGVLVGELVRLYEAFAQGRPSPLEELPLQYADYAAWQREWLQGEALEAQLEYWRARLAGAPPQLELPTDKPRPAVQSSRGGSLRWRLDDAVAEALKEFSRGEGVTLFMTLLAGFVGLLSRHTGQSDIVVGAPIAGRTQAETENLIGFFVNTLALRVRADGDPSFRELVGRVREVTLGAYAHQDIPFEKLVEELRPERSLSQTPLFQVMIDVRRDESETVKLAGLSLSTLVLDWEAAKFDLMFDVVEAKDGSLQGVVEYSTDLFEAETIERLFGRWQKLLGAAAADPSRRVSELPLLTEAEREQLARWNETAAEYPRSLGVHELFEQQAGRTPSAVAVACGDVRLTYGELNARANRLARALAAEGAAPGTLVALLAERGADFLAAMLGVFKAGCAYLPLDPRHPAARHRQVLTQSGAGYVVGDESLAQALAQALEGPGGEGRPRLLTLQELLRRGGRDDNLSLPHGPSDLAYVIYTSGSTGAPKGAMVEHGGMLNHLWAKVTDLGLTGEDVVAQTASQCFDISVWQFLAPLLVGGRTHVFGDEVVRDPARLLGEVRGAGVTVLEVVPSLLRAALEDAAVAQAGRVDLPGLRLLLLTGEALPPDLCRRWLAAYPEIPLLNAYGPTECSDDVTHHLITQPPPEEVARVPVGRPIINTRIYILDGSLRPVPVGARGELYVAGDGVGRGYLNEPGLTARAFVPDPFCAEPGGRLYATGDIARFGPGGVIEYLGRNDSQVKVRGFRIELGEIEAAVNAHDAVRESVVVTAEGARGDRHLVAYLVAEGDGAPGVEELRGFLLQRLPDYMVPSAFVVLGELPLTPNGKIDRKALPAPDPETLLRQADYVGPRTETEKAVARLWAEVLRAERVGIDDNFFDLGGHSLVATQLTSRIQKNFGVGVTLADFFAAPTVRAISERVESALVTQTDSAELDELLNMLEGLGNEEADGLLALDDAHGQAQ